MQDYSQNQDDNRFSRPPGEASADTAPEVAQSTPDSMPSLEELLRKAELQAQEHHDAWLRAKAEADNVRKRAQIEVANAHKFSVESFGREPHDFETAALLGTVRTERRHHDVAARLERASNSVDIPRASVRIGKKMEQGAVVPKVVGVFGQVGTRDVCADPPNS